MTAYDPNDADYLAGQTAREHKWYERLNYLAAAAASTTPAARVTPGAPRAAEGTSAATSSPCGGGGHGTDGGATADVQDLPATSGEGVAPLSDRPWDKRRQVWGPWLRADHLDRLPNYQVAVRNEYGVPVCYVREVVR